MTNEDPRVIKAELDELWRTVRIIVRELHGIESSADPETRSGGLVEDVRFIRDQIENGGVRRKWGRFDSAVAAALIAASGAVVVAVIRSILG